MEVRERGREGGWAGYDHLFSATPQRPRGTSGTAAIREKWTVRMLAKLLSSRAAQKRRKLDAKGGDRERERIGQKWGKDIR